MKRLSLLALLFIIALSASAMPAKRGQWRVLTLKDGSQVSAELVGDEMMHYYRAADGKAYTLGADGKAALVDDLSAMQLKAQKHRLQIGQERAKRLKQFKIQNSKLKAQNLKPKAQNSIPNTQNSKTADHLDIRGQHKGIIILVNFSDSTFRSGHDNALFNKIANGENYREGSFKGSVADYFRDQSNGQFLLSFDVYGPITLPHPASYYGGNSGGQASDSIPAQMAWDACVAANSQYDIDFGQYDWDGDGKVEQVFILYAGKGEADGGGAESVWPHEWLLSEGMGQTLQLGGYTIDTYACGCELSGKGDIDGIGTICHEFSHCLGFPDMYDTANSGNYGMAYWDLMDYGSYNDDGFQPAGYTAYEKMCAGWQEPIVLNSDTVVTGMKAMSNNGDTYIIYNEGDENEYYMLENRQLTGWDEGLDWAEYGYPHGLLITHIDYDENIWALNEVNTTRGTYSGNSHQRCTVIPADDDLVFEYINDPWGDVYPAVEGDYISVSNDSLTNNSTPEATVYNENVDGSYYMNCAIRDITEASDGTISFRFGRNATASTPAVDEEMFYESFDKCNGKGGNDGMWKSINGTAALTPDNEGWTFSSDAYGGNQCARIGSASDKCDAATPGIRTYGQTTVSYKIAPWNISRVTNYYTVAVTDKNDNVIKEQDYDLTAGQWTADTISFDYRGKVFIHFYPSGSNKRFFLDEVKVVNKQTATNGIEAIRSSAPARQSAIHDNRIYSLSGIYLGTDITKLKPGIYIRNGEKVKR